MVAHWLSTAGDHGLNGLNLDGGEKKISSFIFELEPFFFFFLWINKKKKRLIYNVVTEMHSAEGRVGVKQLCSLVMKYTKTEEHLCIII